MQGVVSLIDPVTKGHSLIGIWPGEMGIVDIFALEHARGKADVLAHTWVAFVSLPHVRKIVTREPLWRSKGI